MVVDARARSGLPGTGTEELREDVPLPADTLLRARLLSAVLAGRDVDVTLLSACGEEEDLWRTCT